MSRTKRHIEPWAKLDLLGKTWHNTYVGLGSKPETIDPRSKAHYGYDGISYSWYYVGYPAKGWKENYQGKSRQAAKRRWHKASRKDGKRKMSVYHLEY